MNLRQVITGYLGGDCREFTTNSGKEGINFSIAVNQGQDRDPLWINCTIWNPFQGLAKWLEKGVPVVVEGFLSQPSAWFTQEMVQKLLSKSYPDNKSLAIAISELIRENGTTRVELVVTRITVYGKRGVKNADFEAPQTATQNTTGGVQLQVGVPQATPQTQAQPTQNLGDLIAQKIAEALNGGLTAGAGGETADDVPF